MPPTNAAEIPMNDLVGCRDMELLCRKRAALDTQHRWKWLGEAERWKDIAHRETVARFQGGHPARWRWARTRSRAIAEAGDARREAVQESIVVPAKAGTHNHRRLWLQNTLAVSFKSIGPRRMGPCFRRDDALKIRLTRPPRRRAHSGCWRRDRRSSAARHPPEHPCVRDRSQPRAALTSGSILPPSPQT